MTAADPTTELAEATVGQWYEDFLGRPQRPTQREVDEAEKLLTEHGEAVVLTAYPILLRLMKARWPDALRWGATRAYWPEAIRAVQDQQRRDRECQEQRDRRRREDEDHDRQQAEYRLREQEWDRLPADQRAEIERAIQQAKPGSWSVKAWFRRHCVAEMARRQSAGGVVGELVGHFAVPVK